MFHRVTALAGRVGAWYVGWRLKRKQAKLDSVVSWLKCGGQRKHTVLVRLGKKIGPILVGNKRELPRRWRLRGKAYAHLLVNDTHLPASVTPADLGLKSAVVLEDGRVKQYYGADDDIAEALRR